MRLNIPQKFWKKYIESDMLEREKQLKCIIENIYSVVLIDRSLRESKDYKGKETDIKKLVNHSIKMVIMGYFDDLINTFYVCYDVK